MPLAAGSTLGPYTIVAAIGAGGMGEVYRARDGRLNRDVALKVLPPEAVDAERLQRFGREAQVVASLNHPNVVTIHSVEQSGDLHFLTMELVEGATLGDTIPRGGVPLKRLLQVAISLADAVGAAHARGVIHRDLKPANVMITADGRVKVLDFGVAKLRPVEAVLGDLSTISRHDLTVDGRVLGTLAYMSPEQAEGREVDHRSDIFSLGVVLYELATGTRPFTGASSAALLSAILKDTPAPATGLRPELPAELGRLIRRCLAKDPVRRLQSAVDLRNELDEIMQALESGNPPVSARGTAIVTRHRQIRRLAWAAGFLLVAIASLVAYLEWPTADDKRAVQAFRLNVQPPSGVVLADQGAQTALAISPDGRWVAYRGVSEDARRSGLYLRSTTEPGDRQVWGVGGGTPFFSHDSKWLGFQADKAIWKVAVNGGRRERICDAPDQLRGASWGDDGSVVFWMTDRLWRVPPGGKGPLPLAKGTDTTRYFFPHVLPGSRTALVTLIDQGSVGVVSVENGDFIRTLFEGSSARYVDGFLVFRRLETLYATPFDLGRLAATGDEQAIVEGVSYNEGGSGTSAFDVANTGALIYMRLVRDNEAELLWLDRDNRTAPVDARRENYSWPALEPDNRRVAVHISTPGDGDLWVYNLGTRSWLRRTTGLKTTGPIVWSPNGQWLVFTAVRSSGGREQRELIRIAADGGEPVKLTPPNPSGQFGALDFASSIHDNTVMFTRQVGSIENDLLTLPLDPPGAETIFHDSGSLVITANGQFSPDGRWVAYDSNEAGARQVFVRSRSGSGRRLVGEGRGARWIQEDGKLFLYYRRSNEIWSVPVTSGPASAEFHHGPSKRVIKDDLLGSGPVPPLNSNGFLVVKRDDERRLVFVTHWLDEVRAAIGK